jgi:two-component system, NarL family, response regulator NreC
MIQGKDEAMSIPILLADDHKIMREGLKSLLSKEQGMEVVGEAENGRIAVKMARKLSPKIVIMDITMPELNGMDAARQILNECPGAKIITLSMHSDRRFVVEMFKAGVSGYLLKDSAFEELSRAIKAVMANQKYVSPAIAGMVIEDYVDHMSGERILANELTNREREVLQLIAEGMTTKQIASNLNVSAKTVETHRRKIMKKLNIHSIAELTKVAIQQGLTSVDT